MKRSREAYSLAARAYAKAGLVVVVPDYSKVPSVLFPAFLEDGAQAVRWTCDHATDFGGDPARISVAGHSAGAYTVAMLTLDPRWLRAEEQATSSPPRAARQWFWLAEVRSTMPGPSKAMSG